MTANPALGLHKPAHRQKQLTTDIYNVQGKSPASDTLQGFIFLLLHPSLSMSQSLRETGGHTTFLGQLKGNTA